MEKIHNEKIYNAEELYFDDVITDLPIECRKYFISSIEARLQGYNHKYGMLTCIKSFKIEE